MSWLARRARGWHLPGVQVEPGWRVLSSRAQVCAATRRECSRRCDVLDVTSERLADAVPVVRFEDARRLVSERSPRGSCRHRPIIASPRDLLPAVQRQPRARRRVSLQHHVPDSFPQRRRPDHHHACLGPCEHDRCSVVRDHLAGLEDRVHAYSERQQQRHRLSWVAWGF